MSKQHVIFQNIEQNKKRRTQLMKWRINTQNLPNKIMEI